jgi:hypothetical protein
LKRESVYPMKKTLFLIALTFWTYSFAPAQIFVGLQGGATLSKMDFTNNLNYQYTPIGYVQGFTGGLVFQFLGDKHAGVQIETNFTQRGWIVNDTTAGNDIDTVNTMNYFEMPMLTHINIGRGKLRGLFNLGPYLGYALSREMTVKNGDTGTEESWEYEFDNDKDGRVDFGLALGAGFEYRFSFGTFAAEARYLFGFGDVDKQKESQSEVSQFRVANVLFRLTVPLKKEKPNPPSDPQ